MCGTKRLENNLVNDYEFWHSTDEEALYLYLETGTERMAPRPWLFPAVKGNVEFLKENLIKMAQMT